MEHSQGAPAQQPTHCIDLDFINPAMIEQKNYPLSGETFRSSIGEHLDQTLYDGHLATIH